MVGRAFVLSCMRLRRFIALPASREIIDGLWAISQNQSTKLRKSHRRPRPTTDEGLTQPLQLLRPAGPYGANRCDLWWARYLPPFALTHFRAGSFPRLHG